MAICECGNTVMPTECNDSVIDNTVSKVIGFKRKHSFIDIPDCNCNNWPNKASMHSNILKCISEREIGNKSNNVFNSNVMIQKMDQFKSCKLFLSTHPELHISECEFIKLGLNGRSIIGLWHGNEYNAILYKLELNFTPRSSTVEDDSPNFINNVKKVGPFFSRSIIRDMCDTIFNGQEHVLYVGVESNFNSVKQNIAVLCRLTIHTSHYGKKYTYLIRLLCCCGCRNDNIFAAGTVSGIFVFANEEFTQIRDYGQKVRCTEFNSIGNILYCGIDNRGLVMYDRREDPWKCNDVKINNMNLENITSTKLLSGENAIIVSCLDGTLTQIDLRKNEPLMYYRGHVGTIRKIPFNLSEYVDVLCATGGDKMTRLWSLSTGTQLHAFEPPIPSKRIHSCLISDEYRWSVALFQESKMFVYEPSI